jgi:ADP-ribose pyrophosphatase YjhB (NUDIX family)
VTQPLSPPRTNSRQYPAHPLLGVGALIFSGDQVLLVERGKPPLEGYWSLPGGLVEASERLEDAVVREVKEETGLNVTADRLATVFERIMPDAAGQCEYHYVLVDFYCSVTGGDLAAGDDSKSARWFHLAELPNLLLTEGTLSVIQLCRGGGLTHHLVSRP